MNGHSNGGRLAVKHASDHPETPALVLLSAHGGGRGGVKGSSRAGLMARDRYNALMAQAQAPLVAAGRGRELMLMDAGGTSSAPRALSTATRRCPTFSN